MYDIHVPRISLIDTLGVCGGAVVVPVVTFVVVVVGTFDVDGLRDVVVVRQSVKAVSFTESLVVVPYVSVVPLLSVVSKGVCDTNASVEVTVAQVVLLVVRNEEPSPNEPHAVNNTDIAQRIATPNRFTSTHPHNIYHIITNCFKLRNTFR